MQTTPSTTDNVNYTRYCTLSSLTEIQLEIETLMQSWFDDDNQLHFTTLAIVEALANIFEHGFNTENCAKAKVELSIRKDNNSVTAVLTDNGEAPPNSVVLRMSAKKVEMPNIGVDHEDLPDSGWGLNLIMHATTSIDYVRSGNSNILKLQFNCDNTT